MAAHSSFLAWRIPWTEEPGRLQPIGSQRVRHDRSDLAGMHEVVRKRREEGSSPSCRNLGKCNCKEAEGGRWATKNMPKSLS